MGFPPFRERRHDEDLTEYDNEKARYRAEHMVRAQNERDKRTKRQNVIDMFKRCFDKDYWRA